MKKILFICTGNTCRSPMAQAIFNTICAQKGVDMHAYSAGLATVSGLPASKNAVAVMAEQGIDLSDHSSTFLPELNLSDYDLFVTMNDSQADILRSMGIPSHFIRTLMRFPKDIYDVELGISDPYGKNIETYRSCAEDIRQGVVKLIKTL